jgi:hypothetical protein
MADKDRGESMHAEAYETGRMGPPSAIENDAFTLQGQGPETAQREREVHDQLRADRLAASRDPDYGKSSSSTSSSKPSSSKSSTSKSTSSSSSSSSSS